MKLLPALIPIAASFAGCTERAASEGAPPSDPPRPAAIRDVETPPESCSLTVRFGSYAMGVDRAAATAVEQLLGGDSAVTDLSRHRWGREGEFTLCAQTASPADAVQLFERVRPLLPAKPRGPIQVAVAGGRTFEAPQETRR